MLYPSLNHHTISFSGPDAQAFLESQLTHKVASLSVGDWQWQGYCTAKGRLLATFALVRNADNGYLAIIHQSVSAAIAKKLTMFRLRSKVEITVITTPPVWLALDVAAQEQAPASALCLPLGDGRAFVISENSTPEIMAPADSPETLAANARWQLAAIAAQQPEITAETVEMFVPQMLGWDTIAPTGGVSFSKGCFPGQEIVARAHYRGAVKRHLEMVEDLPAEVVKPGSEITLPDGRVVEVCNAALRDLGTKPPRWNALVVAANA